jgi:hypothetical protein
MWDTPTNELGEALKEYVREEGWKTVPQPRYARATVQPTTPSGPDHLVFIEMFPCGDGDNAS